MENKTEMIGKIRNVFKLLDEYQDLGNYMLKEDKQRIRDDLACFMDFLAGKYIIPKEDLHHTKEVDNDGPVVGNYKTTTIKFELHGPQRRFVMNPYFTFDEEFEKYAEEEFVNEIEHKYKF